MKQDHLLRNFEYSIIPASKKFASAGSHKYHADYLPLMQLKIDFSHGRFLLSGDWQFMIESNIHGNNNRILLHRKRVEIDLEIYPFCLIDLNDNSNDGLILSMKGTLNDGMQVSSCTGMVVFENTWVDDETKNNLWQLSFYLYDYSNENSEIKFKLPVYL
jgi:hypothetical protein